MRLLFVFLLTAALFAPACQRSSGPSPEYEQARQRWTALLREKGLEGAFVDARAQEVVDLLGQVDRKSVDAPYSDQLRGEIEAGRREAGERTAAFERREVEIRGAAAKAAAAMGTRLLEAAPQPAEPAVPPAEPPPDAGAKDDQPRQGMEAERFKRDFARCFEFKNPSIVQGRAGGEVWGLKDLIVCRELHRPFDGNAVLLMDGKVVAIRSASELAPKRFKVVDGKLVEAGPETEPKPVAPESRAEPDAGSPNP
jgi:hypothetical protein